MVKHITDIRDYYNQVKPLFFFFFFLTRKQFMQVFNRLTESLRAFKKESQNQAIGKSC